MAEHAVRDKMLPGVVEGDRPKSIYRREKVSGEIDYVAVRTFKGFAGLVSAGVKAQNIVSHGSDYAASCISGPTEIVFLVSAGMYVE